MKKFYLFSVLISSLLILSSCSSHSGKMSINLGNPVINSDLDDVSKSNLKEHELAFKVASNWFEVVPGESTLLWEEVNSMASDLFLDLKIKKVKKVFLNSYFLSKPVNSHNKKYAENPAEYFAKQYTFKLINAEGNMLSSASYPEMFWKTFDLKKNFEVDSDRLQEFYDFATSAELDETMVLRINFGVRSWSYETESTPSLRRIIKDKLISGIMIDIHSHYYGWDFVGEDLWGNAERDAAIKAAADRERAEKKKAFEEEQARRARNWLRGGK